MPKTSDLILHYRNRRKYMVVGLSSAMFVTLSIFYWSFGDPQIKPSKIENAWVEEERKRISENKYLDFIKNAHLDSVDKDGNPCVIRAVEAHRTKPELYFVKQPEMEMSGQDGLIKISSKQGFVNEAEKAVVLEENVLLNHEEGYDIFTEKAYINTLTGDIESDVPSRAQSEGGWIDATGFKSLRGQSILKIYGPSMLHLAAAKPDTPVIVESAQGFNIYHDTQQIEAPRAPKTPVHARHGAQHLYAASLIADYADSAAGTRSIEYLEAIGQVRLVEGEMWATGDRGVFDVASHHAELQGPDLKAHGPQFDLRTQNRLGLYKRLNLIIAYDTATIETPERTIRGDYMVAAYSEDQGKNLENVYVVGNASCTIPDGIIRGRQAVYDRSRGKVYIWGQVRMTRKKTQMNGKYAELDVQTNKARLWSKVPKNTGPYNIGHDLSHRQESLSAGMFYPQAKEE